MSVTATIVGSRTVLVPKAEAAMPAPRSKLDGGFTQQPMGDGRVQLFNPQGEPCGICASQRVADSTMRVLNR